MLASARRSRILDAVRDHGSVRVADLAVQLDVSDMTIRRDLDALAEQGVVRKVHGGAVLAGERAIELGFERKRRFAAAEKRAIARRAAQLVRPGTAVALSAGTTTWQLAQELAQIDGLTLVTNSTNVAMQLHRLGVPGQSIVLTGGVFRTPSDALTGPIADAALRGLNVDVLFLGAHGLDLHAGVTTPNLAEAQTNRTMIASAGQVVVVADHTKWGVVGLATFAPLRAVDVLVTDTGFPRVAREAVADQVGEILFAEPDALDAPA
ncbi:DeoR/GlpR family DNA-binding transcription regulator [Egicoccus halophilus]|uniref:DeoR family transcriptional regulator n=1 Tax=Egicoccus halophilus TaxID=1670830 RepID=A0A8J3EWF5_9ACTN|nr:DeoR/GlpR family DNA-binding transcription regulator [Egicoccus halophilus]GGI03536.1 DeoR family transcriptional regulator [Egicoccus halophilus]